MNEGPDVGVQTVSLDVRVQTVSASVHVQTMSYLVVQK